MHTLETHVLNAVGSSVKFVAAHVPFAGSPQSWSQVTPPVQVPLSQINGPDVLYPVEQVKLQVSPCAAGSAHVDGCGAPVGARFESLGSRWDVVAALVCLPLGAYIRWRNNRRRDYAAVESSV